MSEVILNEARRASLDIFRSVQVLKCISGQNLVSTSAETSIFGVCSEMSEKNVSSMVIVDENGFLGIVDHRNIVSFISGLVEKDKTIAHNREMLNKALNASITTIMDFSVPRNHYLVLEDTSVLVPIGVMMYGVHRVAVSGVNGNVIGVLSQTDIFRLLASDEVVMNHLSKVPIDCLRCRPIESSTISNTLMAAFSKMVEKNHSSIAIITEEHGKLIGNISSKDVQYLLRNKISLQTSCLDVVSTKLLDCGVENDGKDEYPFFAVSKDSTIGYAIERLLVSKTHRIWVTNDNFQPTGIVSMDDILHLLFSECKQISSS